MKITHPKAVASKLIKARLMLKDRQLAEHVPSTKTFNREHLFQMLETYRMVYIKPDLGSQGIGVMRIDKKKTGYRYHSGIKSHFFTKFQDMYLSLRRRIGGVRYLVQQGVHVLRHEKRPFDFRVMIQKNPKGKWECTGTAGRVAHPQKAVTNGSQGGTIFKAESLIEPRAGNEKTAELLKKMNGLAEQTAVQLSRTFPKLNELGVDIAVDSSLKPWILEANSKPDPCPFTKLDDKSMIRKIKRYGKAYGRRYCLRCTKAKQAPKSSR